MPGPPAARNEGVAGLAEYVHGAAAWVIVNDWPPIVSVAVRGLAVEVGGHRVANGGVATATRPARDRHPRR